MIKRASSSSASISIESGSPGRVNRMFRGKERDSERAIVAWPRKISCFFLVFIVSFLLIIQIFKKKLYVRQDDVR